MIKNSFYNDKGILMLRCSTCGQWKEEDYFYKNNQLKRGYNYECKDCGKKQRLNNTKRANTYAKEYYIENIDKVNNGRLLRKFGITLKEYRDLFNGQNGCCAICGRHQSELIKAMAVDHNHITKEIRGLLCSQCNIFLGYCKDNIVCFENAIDYLKGEINLND